MLACCKVEVKVELKNLIFQVDVVNVMKLLLLGEEDKILTC